MRCEARWVEEPISGRAGAWGLAATSRADTLSELGGHVAVGEVGAGWRAQCDRVRTSGIMSASEPFSSILRLDGG
jgi:hypothetical protein